MYQQHRIDHKQTLNILLGITGSVASIKLVEMTEKLRGRLAPVNICVVPTHNALHFVPDFDAKINEKMASLSERLCFLRQSTPGLHKDMLGDHAASRTSNQGVVFSFCDSDEWSSWSSRGDPVLHIELKKWAHLMLIAPLDANTLAKLSNGMCDNLLTCVARAWDLERVEQRPIVVCPAMNTFMYKQPITERQLRVVCDEYGYKCVPCVEKTLVCGDSGLGAMANVDTIVDTIVSLVS